MGSIQPRSCRAKRSASPKAARSRGLRYGNDKALRAKPERQLRGGPASFAVELHADLVDTRQHPLGSRQDVPLGAFAIELQEIESVDGIVLHQALERDHLDDSAASSRSFTLDVVPAAVTLVIWQAAPTAARTVCTCDS